MTYTLRSYQQAAVDSAWSHLRTQAGNPIIVLPTGCHGQGHPILMADGNIRQVESIIPGELVMGADGSPREVLQLCRGLGNLYLISPIKGDPFVVNEDHILYLEATREGKPFPSSRQGGEVTCISVKDYLNKSKSWRHLYKLRQADAISFADYKSHHLLFDIGYEIPPYIVGLMLGDGHMRHSISLTSADQECANEFIAFAGSHGWGVTTIQKPDNQAKQYCIHSNSTGKVCPAKKMFARVGMLGKVGVEKHIPKMYGVSSRQTRLEVLAGLMDSDGHHDGRGGFIFSNKSERLCRGVVFIARSLGLRAIISIIRKRCQTCSKRIYWQVSISGDTSIIPCRLARKKALPRQQIKNVLRSGFIIEPYGKGNYFGFTLSGDHLYLDGNFLIHHNSGKSLVIAQLCADAMRWGGKVLVVQHRKELINQNAEKIRALIPNADLGVYSAGLNKRHTEHDIVCCGIQSVFKRAYDFGQRNAVIVDECLTGETLVSTPSGCVPISTIVPGDLVHNATGVGLVIAINKSYSRSIHRVEFTNGSFVRCTANHRFFASSRWTRADQLEAGESIADFQTVFELRARVSSSDQQEHGTRPSANSPSMQGSVASGEILLDSLCKAPLQPCWNGNCQEETKRWTQGQGVDVLYPWRQRTAHCSSRSAITEYSWRRLGFGSCDPNEETQGNWISDVLQSGRREQFFEDCNRSGRSITFDVREKGSRQKERFVVASVWVEGDSHIEQRSKTPVYDLQVSGHPSFFAGGVLVHNCHLVPHDDEGMYRHFLDDLRSANERLRCIGLTATPFRLDVGPLCRPDAIFQKVCYSAPIGQLIDDGYLCRLTTKRAAGTINTSGIHLRGGEFIAGEAASVFDRASEAACAEIVAATQGCQSILIFCSGVQHALHVAGVIERLTSETCGVVTGESLPLERAGTLEAFSGRRLRWLVNVDVLTTGFDAPCIDAICLLRATMSPGLYAQICGRGFRMFPGKDNCRVLDFGGNILRHGPLDAIDYGRTRDASTPGEAPTKVCPNCESELLIATSECPGCGFLFPINRKPVDTTASDAPILSEPETWDVEDVVYSVHHKKKDPTAPPTLRVDYIVSLNGRPRPMPVMEFICLDHEGYAHSKARKWWAARSNAPVPASVAEADYLAKCGALAWPRRITVRREGKWERIVNVELEKKPAEWLANVEELEETPF